MEVIWVFLSGLLLQELDHYQFWLRRSAYLSLNWKNIHQLRFLKNRKNDEG